MYAKENFDRVNTCINQRNKMIDQSQIFYTQNSKL